MREIVLDTETTGFDPQSGDRIVEIGCIELFNHLPTGKTFHKYINPERGMPADAFAVHGLGDDFLRDKPVFAKIGQEFVDFVGDSKMIIHNASFDMKFLNAELKWMNLPVLPWEQALDTLAIARKKFPGSPASLDALCRRFGISGFSRDLHGALLDSQILAEVYLELIGGRQPDLVMTSSAAQESKGAETESNWHPQPRENKLPSRVTEAEAKAHQEFIASIGEDALWNKLS